MDGCVHNMLAICHAQLTYPPSMNVGRSGMDEGTSHLVGAHYLLICM
jgi:hypothetical protein